MSTITSKGIHHVSVAQKNRVKPLRKGINAGSRLHVSAAKRRRDPASVVIANALMFIQ